MSAAHEFYQEQVNNAGIADLQRHDELVAARARLEVSGVLMEHNDTYEGSCGVHMPAFCKKCQRIAALRAEVERLEKEATNA